MVRLAIEGHPDFQLATVETDRPGPSYMIETIGRLEEARPDDDFSLIIGGDSLRAFHTWFRYEEIVRRAGLIVYDRSGLGYSEVEERILQAVTWIPEPPVIGISSSDIRGRVQTGQSIRYLVPEPVEQYIRRRNLYSA
jgi:nicotinate-nucleotide adenylyltransferase